MVGELNLPEQERHHHVQCTPTFWIGMVMFEKIVSGIVAIWKIANSLMMVMEVIVKAPFPKCRDHDRFTKTHLED